jgi:tRNA(Ile)-lysidine synthase
MPVEIADRVEPWIRRHGLIEPGGEVACLVSGGADSTCLWHVLGQLGYRVSAVHVAHGLRGDESAEDARHCRDLMGAEIVRSSYDLLQGLSEAALRDDRYRLTERFGLRATGHTASDQVETVLYRLVASGNARGIKPRREDGVVRPLLPLWREETEAYCRERRLPFRVDSSNPDTKRGLIRDRILPLLRELHPGADRNLLALADERTRLPRALERTLAALLESTDGSKTSDLGHGVRATREYGSVRLEGGARFGSWIVESDVEGLQVRTRLPGDRLAGRRKKVQDLFVDAKVPRRERDAWPLVVAEDGVVAIPGIAEAPGWEGVVRSWKDTNA